MGNVWKGGKWYFIHGKIQEGIITTLYLGCELPLTLPNVQADRLGDALLSILAMTSDQLNGSWRTSADRVDTSVDGKILQHNKV